MKPKERRDRLFKTSRPNIREMQLIDENGYTQDMKILWGAYKKANVDEGVSQKEFADIMMADINPYKKKWIIEDDNAFCGGHGPIGMVLADYDGWNLDLNLESFKWATPRNILRAAVSFLQMMRYDRTIGIVNAYSLKKDKGFLNHVSQYGVLKYAAKIPNGDKDGDKYIYYIRGRK